MKKQALAFILNASLVTINPLSGMEFKDEDLGLGAFRKLPPEKIIPILAMLPLPDLNSVESTSKAMQTLCEAPEIWKAIAKDLPIRISKTLSIKNQIKEYYFLFNNPEKTYSIPIYMLQYFTKIRSPYPAIYTYYHFSFGKKRFRLRNRSHYSIFDKDLEIKFYKAFDMNAHITFSLKPNTDYFVSYFSLLTNVDYTIGVLLNGVDDEILGESIKNKDEEIKQKFPNPYGLYNLIHYSLYNERDPTGPFGPNHPFWSKEEQVSKNPGCPVF